MKTKFTYVMSNPDDIHSYGSLKSKSYKEWLNLLCKMKNTFFINLPTYFYSTKATNAFLVLFDG